MPAADDPPGLHGRAFGLAPPDASSSESSARFFGTAEVAAARQEAAARAQGNGQAMHGVDLRLLAADVASLSGKPPLLPCPRR